VDGTKAFQVHENVDLLKSVGLGPGIPFACAHMDQHNQTDEEESSSRNMIGLIPTAVGATFLEEWSPSFIPIVANPLTTSAISSSSISDGSGGGDNEDAHSSDYSKGSGRLQQTPVCNEFGRLCVPDNCKYAKGCINLLSSALRTLYASLISIPPQRRAVRFAGILWYQGENDASLAENEALTYGRRFDSFLNHLNRLLESLIRIVRLKRELNFWQITFSSGNSNNSSSGSSGGSSCGGDSEDGAGKNIVPLISVAITTTRRAQCVNRDAVRFQQLERKNTITSGNMLDFIVDMVDSFGLPLQNDNVHINLSSILALGKKISAVYSQIIRGISEGERNDALAAYMNMKSKSYSDSRRILHSLGPWGDVIEMPDHRSEPSYTMLSDKIREAETTYTKIKQRVEAILKEKEEKEKEEKAALAADKEHSSSSSSSLILDVVRSRSFSSKIRSQVSNPSNSFPILQSGLKAANFTYGELNFLDFCRVLTVANVSANDTFVDLGSGTGILLAAACLGGFPFASVTGIELSKTKVVESKILVEEIQKGSHTKVPKVEIIEGNFLLVPWSGYDVIYTCSTCFASDQMARIKELCSDMKLGSKIIFVDKQPFNDSNNRSNTPLESSSSSSPSPESSHEFKQIGSCQCRTSWGYADVFIYQLQEIEL
jgi:hypothetical protein